MTHLIADRIITFRMLDLELWFIYPMCVYIYNPIFIFICLLVLCQKVVLQESTVNYLYYIYLM